MTDSRGALRIGMIGYAFMGAAHSQAWRTVNRVFDLPLPLDCPERAFVTEGGDEARPIQDRPGLAVEALPVFRLGELHPMYAAPQTEACALASRFDGRAKGLPRIDRDRPRRTGRGCRLLRDRKGNMARKEPSGPYEPQHCARFELQ